MTVNIAFFGTGELARPYLDALARRPDVQLAGVCDPERRSAEQVAAGWGARLFPSPANLLETACPDALFVCVGPQQMGDVLLQAAEKRVPFFVVPPGATDAESAARVAAAVRDTRLVTTVGFSTQHADVAREAREFLGANSAPLALGWWLRPASEPGRSTAIDLLWNEAAGTVDALRYFCGEVVRVQAFGSEGQPADKAGALVLHLAFARGTTGVLTLATFARPEPRVEFELLGEGWALHFDEGLRSLRVSEHDKTTILRRLNDPAADHAAAFLEAVATGEPTAVAPSYDDALATLAVCRAAALSAAEGRPVEPDVTRLP
jgi:predicted dehydrogenase